MPLIIFTGLDGMLLSLEEIDYDRIAIVVKDLQQKNILLIPITNNTRAEVKVLIEKIDIDVPFVVEQGSGIFIPQDNKDFDVSETETLDSYHFHQLGCTYTEARAALKAVQEEISKILRGFGDLDEENIQAMMGGVSPAAARRAKSREFSEYFLTPNRLEIGKLQEVAQEYGFKIIPEGKLSLMMGGGANKGKAINWLKEHYQSNSLDSISTIGIGSTQQDLPILEAVDTPIVVPSSTGIELTNSKNKGWQTVANSGLEGWLEAIALILRDHSN